MEDTVDWRQVCIHHARWLYARRRGNPRMGRKVVGLELLRGDAPLRGYRLPRRDEILARAREAVRDGLPEAAWAMCAHVRTVPDDLKAVWE